MLVNDGKIGIAYECSPNCRLGFMPVNRKYDTIRAGPTKGTTSFMNNFDHNRGRGDKTSSAHNL